MKILSRIGDAQWKEKESRATLRAGNAAREITRETPHGRPRRRLRERPYTGDHTRETTQGRPHGRRTGDASGTISESFREPYPETAGKTNILRWPREGKPKGDTRETIRKQNRFAHKFWRRETNHGTVFDPKMGSFFNAAHIKKLLKGSKNWYQI